MYRFLTLAVHGLFSAAILGTALTRNVESATPPAEMDPMELRLGGVGGVYLLAEPGELVVEVQKQDLNRGPVVTQLRAILAGPDRQVLQEATIADDGRPAGSGLGPVQRTRLTAQVPRRGVYVLNITTSNDRYGEAANWGFTTNCRHYVIETARGHKDERHQEPIVLRHPKRPGDVVFPPRRKAFSIDVSGLPKDAAELTLQDVTGRLLATLKADDQGKATHSLPAADCREATPWSLHLPAQQATIHIDGVTRWDADDQTPNSALWTNSVAAWFPLPDFRWLITPYHRTVYAESGTTGELKLRVHNNSGRPQTIALSLEFPGATWPASLSAEHVKLAAGRSGEVAVGYTVPSAGQVRVVHVRATPQAAGGISTYSTVEVRAGMAPAAQPLTMPLTLKPYQHENEQFGHRPAYPVEYQFAFDPQNRPLAWAERGLVRFDGGRWPTAELTTAVRTDDGQATSGSFHMAATKLASDREGRIYALALRGRQAFLLCSADSGRTFSATLIPGRESAARSFDFENFSGHNGPDGPPPILRYTRTGEDPRLFWRRINDLELLLPRWQDGRIVMAEPVLVTRRCIGLAAHSGIPSSVASRGNRVHVVWGEATEPSVKVPGVPTYAATYDRDTGRLSPPALTGYGAPPNDVHNSPSLTLDSRGYLHVLAGTHGQPFVYARSLAPNDAAGGWTKPEPVGKDARQTYIGLVCGPDDTLHAVFRLWQQGKEPFPLAHHATLAYQRKRPAGPWEEPRVLIVAPFSEYSVFYHRLTIDRRGRLWLSYDYWSTFWFYRNDQPGSRRSLLLSPDGGTTWKLAGEDDFAP